MSLFSSVTAFGLFVIDKYLGTILYILNSHGFYYGYTKLTTITNNGNNVMILLIFCLTNSSEERNGPRMFPYRQYDLSFYLSLKLKNDNFVLQ